MSKQAIHKTTNLLLNVAFYLVSLVFINCLRPLRKLIQQLFKVFIEVDSNHYIFDILSDIVPRVDRNANLYINSSGITTILVEPYVKTRILSVYHVESGTS